MQETNGTYIIDASDPACSNWLRFFNAPSSYEQENVVPVSCAGTIFYMASRDIEPGTELLVWYGDSYGRYLGVNRIHPGKLVFVFFACMLFSAKWKTDKTLAAFLDVAFKKNKYLILLVFLNNYMTNSVI